MNPFTEQEPLKLLPPSEFEKPKATAGGVLPEVKSAADEILALKLENQRLRYIHYMNKFTKSLLYLLIAKTSKSRLKNTLFSL